MQTTTLVMWMTAACLASVSAASSLPSYDLLADRSLADLDAQPGPGALKVLSRHRRYVVFPEGSTFNAALCMTIKVSIPRDVDIFTEGVAWGVSYDLPNNTQAVASAGAGVEPAERRRRDRRDLYRRLERAVDSAGLDGRSCLLRAVCESAQLSVPERSLAMELMRVAFAIPIGRKAGLRAEREREQTVYADARRTGLAGHDCETVFPGCPISLVSLASTLTPTQL